MKRAMCLTSLIGLSTQVSLQEEASDMCDDYFTNVCVRLDYFEMIEAGALAYPQIKEESPCSVELYYVHPNSHNMLTDYYRDDQVVYDAIELSEQMLNGEAEVVLSDCRDFGEY